MSAFCNYTLDEIKSTMNPHWFYQANDAGMVYDEAIGKDVPAIDFLVWMYEEDSRNDDGQNAIARYLIRAQ